MDLLLRLSFNSFATPWQVSFQKPATTMMEGIIDLHHDIFTFLVIIIVFVSFMLATIFWRYIEPVWTQQLTALPRTKFQSGHGITHNTILETVWTIIPTLVLLLIATPSFALIYALDEIVEPQLTIRIVGRQWYWTYEYPDTVPLAVPFQKIPAEGQIGLDASDNAVQQIVERLVSQELLSYQSDDLRNKDYRTFRHVVPHFSEWQQSFVSALQTFLTTEESMSKVDLPVIKKIWPEDLTSMGFLPFYLNFLATDTTMVSFHLEGLETDTPSVLSTDALELAINQFSAHDVGGEAASAINLDDFIDPIASVEYSQLLSFIGREQEPLLVNIYRALAVPDSGFLAGFLVASLEEMPGILDVGLILNIPGFTINSYIIPTEDLYPGAFRLLEVNRRMAIPFGTNIRLLMTAYDVIHSWAVPAFGVKVDCLPGRLNEYFLNVNYRGIFYGQCSEICGVNHGFMPIKVEVMTDEHFRWWFASTSLGENTAIRFRALWQLTPECRELVRLVFQSGRPQPQQIVLEFFTQK